MQKELLIHKTIPVIEKNFINKRHVSPIIATCDKTAVTSRRTDPADFNIDYTQ